MSRDSAKLAEHDLPLRQANGHNDSCPHWRISKQCACLWGSQWLRMPLRSAPLRQQPTRMVGSCGILPVLLSSNTREVAQTASASAETGAVGILRQQAIEAGKGNVLVLHDMDHDTVS